ncbi:hypothetical protein E6H36_07690 [Candidatus Bathyarchaeota archaeon]|nr:MAG: hypothetical protein E6H36_07690 [Candidatus Bathyarchaeota archaeon]
MFSENSASREYSTETSTTRAVLFSDEYQPFGQDNATPTGSETYKFTGKPYSSAIGLYRKFLAARGRF